MEGDAGVKSRSMPHDINLESFHYTFPRYYVRNEKYYLKKYFVPTIIEIYFESSPSSIFEDKIFNLRSRLLSSEKVHTHHPIPPLFLLTIHCIERSKPISPLLFSKAFPFPLSINRENKHVNYHELTGRLRHWRWNVAYPFLSWIKQDR